MKSRRSWAIGLLHSFSILVVSLSLASFAIPGLAARRSDEVRQAEVQTQKLALALTPQISAEIPGKHALILTGYSYGVPLHDNYVSGLFKALNEHGMDSKDIHVETLGLDRNSSQDFRQMQAALLTKKYAGIPIDLVFCVSQFALNFLLDAAPELAPGAPVLSWNARLPAGHDTGQRQFVVQTPRLDFRGTLQLALALFPLTKRVIVTTGNSEQELARQEAIRSDLSPWQGKLEIEETYALSAEEIEAKLATVPEHTILMGVSLTKDAKGHVFVPIDFLRRITKSAKAPYFALHDVHLGIGTIGGMVSRGSDDAAHLGDMGIDILQGKIRLSEPVTTIPGIAEPVFDWQQLQRWGAKRDALPARTLFINRPPTLWDQHKAAVIATVIVILALTLLVAGLSIMNRRLDLAKKASLMNEARFRTLVEHAPEAIVVVDVETGTFTDVNDQACQLYRLSLAELLTKKSEDLSPPFQPDDRASSEKARDMLQRAAAGESHRFEWVHRNSLGVEFPCEVQMTRLPSAQRVSVRVSLTDVTERKLAEEEKHKLQAQLMQSQKMESLGTLAGGVAHDINNVLGAILGLASAHLNTQPHGSPLHQALDTICKATVRGGRMVKSLLSFARQSPAESHELDMNAILREQVSLLERTTLAKVSLRMDLEAELRPILGDASALTHAFMNLCVNAVDAMPENGTLTLHTCNVDNDWIEVVVEDNGTGMPKEVLEKAMDPFFTTKGIGKGTGLGLSMVFSTVKAHRGQMAIQSEPDKGTRVMLRFPACEPNVQFAPAAVAAVMQPLHGSLKVLLVDDDDLIQSSTLAILEVLGHTAVTTAQSGEEALTLLEAGLDADLVILDMNMPGLGGIGTMPGLRVLRPEVPVLLATGRVDQTALTLASSYPGVTLLSKPFGLGELQKHLENIGLG
jgi:two-component system, sensor histidine kinase and response regulator